MYGKREYEFVDYTALGDIKLFIVDIVYRNMHLHKEFEVFQVLQGRMEVSTPKKTLMLDEGDFALFNPRQGHQFRSTSNMPVRIMPLQVSPNFWSRHYPQMSNVEFDAISINQHLKENFDRFQKSYLQVADNYFSKDSYYEMTCAAEVNRLMRILLLCVPWYFLTEYEKKSKHSISQRMSRILRYIEDHYTEKLLLKDICEVENLSLYRMSHYFAEKMNMPFQEYLNLLRFERAKVLVEQTEMKLTDIAFSSGFSDVRYMNNIFKKLVGCSPSEYRNGQANKTLFSLPQAQDAEEYYLDEEESLNILYSLG